MFLPRNTKLNEETNDLRRLIRDGARKDLWSTLDECAEAIGMSPNTLGHHVKDNYDLKVIQPTIVKVFSYMRAKKIRAESAYVPFDHGERAPPSEPAPDPTDPRKALDDVRVNSIVLLISHLQREMDLIAKLDPVLSKDQRQEIFKALAPGIDRLFVSIKQLEQVVPSDAAAWLLDLEDAREFRDKKK